MHGVAFGEDGKERGLAYSDVAILLRSVKGNAEPITKALRDAGIPSIVVGMNDLFSAVEAEAARLLFYFMAKRPGVDRKLVRKAWLDANLGIADAALDAALDKVEAAERSWTALIRNDGRCTRSSGSTGVPRPDRTP